jgi:hypothetical protein
VLEKDGNTSMLQSSGKNDELNKESSIPSLPASSSDLHLNSSSQEVLVQLLEKASMKSLIWNNQTRHCPRNVKKCKLNWLMKR